MLEQRSIRRYLSYAAYVLAVLVIGWGFTPYPRIFLSLILGTIIGFLNIILLYFRVEKAGRAVAAGKKVRSLGMLTRFALAGLAVFIVITFPEIFHMVSMIFGLMIPYVIIFFDFAFTALRTQRK